MIKKYDKFVADITCGTTNGSGFVISKDVVITAYHVVKAAPVGGKVTILLPFLFSEPHECEATVRALDELLDIALLVLVETLQIDEEIKLSNEPLVESMLWRTFGFPSNMRQTGIKLVGCISRDSLDIDNFPYEVSLELESPFDGDKQGLSGSPLVIGDSICGFIIKKEQEQSRFLGAISFNRCSDFFKENGVTYSDKINFNNIENYKNLYKIKQHSIAIMKRIPKDIFGITLNRKSLIDEYQQKIQSFDFIYISGISGSGKSVLLQKIAEQYELENSLIFFISPEATSGANSWQQFSISIGLNITDHQDFFTDIASLGNPTLFIDSIDRLGPSNQALIKDILNYIDGTKSSWKYIVTLRDYSIDSINSWLPEAVKRKNSTNIEVGILNDDDANILSASVPSLRPLLFGEKNIRDIARRPFFAKILSQQHGPETIILQSELDLLEAWWKRGGSTSQIQNLIQRQNVLMSLSNQAFQKPDFIISQRDFLPITISEIQGLKEDGVIQDVKTGRVKFAHDIFLEWSYCFELALHDECWVTSFKQAGERPMLDHVINLLSQFKVFDNYEGWVNDLNLLRQEDLRSQWFRTWLSAPLFNPKFEIIKEIFFETLKNDDFSLLESLLQIFKTEKTKPFSQMINELLEKGHVKEYETPFKNNNIPIPNDGRAWQRLIKLIIDNLSDIPPQVIPKIIEFFTIWHIPLALNANPVSDVIIALVYDWLLAIEYINHINNIDNEKSSYFDKIDNKQDFERDLRFLLLFSSQAYPDYLVSYLSYLVNNTNVSEKIFHELLEHSVTISKVASNEFILLTRKLLLDELPELQQQKWMFGSINDKYLSINTDFDHVKNGFQPASPLKEPFHSLLINAPRDTLDLIKELSNHAVTAWLQINNFKQKIPVAIKIVFPWGEQIFWGDETHYLWHRGHNAPYALGCALMALEEWAFLEIKNGVLIDEVLKEILVNNTSFSVLAIGLEICLEHKHISDISISIIGCPHLWVIDFYSKNYNLANLLGFSKSQKHYDAVNKMNIRHTRSYNITNLFHETLTPKYISFFEKGCELIKKFSVNLPFFYEEKVDPAVLDKKKKMASRFAELGKKENYSYSKDKANPHVIKIIFNNPLADEQSFVEEQEEHNKTVNIMGLKILITETFEGSRLHDSINLAQAVAFAKRFDVPDIFVENGNISYSISNPESFVRSQYLITILSVAAIVNMFDSDTKHLQWAKDFIIKFLEAQELTPSAWRSSNADFENPLSFLAIFLLANIKHKRAEEKDFKLLFELLAFRFDYISNAILNSIWMTFESNNLFFWTAFDLALRLAYIDKCQPKSLTHEDFERSKQDYILTQLNLTSENFFNNINFSVLYTPKLFLALNVDHSSNIINYNDSQSSISDWDEIKLASILKFIPIKIITTSEQREIFISFYKKLFDWSIYSFALPEESGGIRNARGVNAEYTSILVDILIKSLNIISIDDLKKNYLTKVFKMKNIEFSFEFLNFFIGQLTEVFMCEKQPSQYYIQVLDLCVDRVLLSESFNRENQKNKITDSDLLYIMQHFFVINIQRLKHAKRFANDDWSEINIIIPIIDKIIRKAGWLTNVMRYFLILCERSKSNYSCHVFIDQVLFIITEYKEKTEAWVGLDFIEKISSMIHFYIQDDIHLDLKTKQKMLIILDFLIEAGDTYSATIRQLPALRNISL